MQRYACFGAVVAVRGEAWLCALLSFDAGTEILAQGYEQRKVNPLYRSTLNDLGSQPPTRFDLPAKYEPLSTKFSGVRVESGVKKRRRRTSATSSLTTG